MAAIKLVSIPQTVQPGNSNQNTLEWITRKSGKFTLAILVTVGSFQFNADGAIVTASASHAAGGSSEKLIVSVTLNDTGASDQKVLLYFKGAGTTDTFIVSLI